MGRRIGRTDRFGPVLVVATVIALAGPAPHALADEEPPTFRGVIDEAAKPPKDGKPPKPADERSPKPADDSPDPEGEKPPKRKGEKPPKPKEVKPLKPPDEKAPQADENLAPPPSPSAGESPPPSQAPGPQPSSSEARVSSIHSTAGSSATGSTSTTSEAAPSQPGAFPGSGAANHPKTATPSWIASDLLEIGPLGPDPLLVAMRNVLGELAAMKDPVVEDQAAVSPCDGPTCGRITGQVVAVGLVIVIIMSFAFLLLLGRGLKRQLVM